MLKGILVKLGFGAATAGSNVKNKVPATPEATRAMDKLHRMVEHGIVKFKWVHSGVPLPCNGEDHSKLDGKKFVIASFVKSGKNLPGGVAGCRCTFTADIAGF